MCHVRKTVSCEFVVTSSWLGVSVSLFLYVLGWMKDTVMTAADPAIPTWVKRLGAAAAEVAMRGFC